MTLITELISGKKISQRQQNERTDDSMDGKVPQMRLLKKKSKGKVEKNENDNKKMWVIIQNINNFSVKLVEMATIGRTFAQLKLNDNEGHEHKSKPPSQKDEAKDERNHFPFLVEMPDGSVQRGRLIN